MDQHPESTTTDQANAQTQKSSAKPRGFAALTPERMREIASAGGRKAHRLQRAHKWTAAEAKEAGRLGGKAAQAKRSKDENREHARRGGVATQDKRRSQGQAGGSGGADER